MKNFLHNLNPVVMLGAHNKLKDEQYTTFINGRQFKLATMNRRLIATVVDVFIIFIITTPILRIIAYYLYNRQTSDQVYEGFENFSINIVGISSAIEFAKALPFYLMNNGLIRSFIILQILSFSFFALFVILFWKWKGATPGKMITRCQIIDANTGDTPTLKQYILRFVGYTFFIGFLFMPLTKKKQGLHDKLANTIVIVKPWKSKT
ncbi:hypothetical protein I862_01610 [endosymbiont of Acanthamoeba sp. UWC8]|uniref:RDD family protein n=1 Tax=endosymbiont of Acanthamoeba sp. UWC8 TaxID=86106 RepID=UPI0004D0E3BF|nr:RDD family protein [endosymbiont of Acanthamoeba sp. UWC8]AIF80885.1 hypothetical protein I862_01610 [endosymbiont of Acanthamoeba sp. UWC8]